MDGQSTESKKNTSSDDAEQLVKRAISAMGGPKARKLLRRGYVKMTLEGKIPQLVEQFGDSHLTFEAYFDLPGFERRDVYADPEANHLIIVTNKDSMWIGDEKGTGKRMPSPPASVYRGPLLIGILQNLFEMLGNSARLEFEGTNSETAIVGIHAGEGVYNRVSFDVHTGLPLQVEKMFFEVSRGEMGGPVVETTTIFEDYKQFSSATLPTKVSVRQAEKKVLEVRIISADFESTIDMSRFEIPD